MALQLKVGCLFFPHWPHPVVFWTPSWLFAQGSSRWGLGTTKDASGSNLGPPCARQAPWLLYSLAAGLCPKCWPFLSQPVLWRSTYASLDTFNLPQSFSKESTSLSFTSFLWDIREPIRSRQRSGLIPPLPEKSITSFQLPKNPGLGSHSYPIRGSQGQPDFCLNEAGRALEALPCGSWHQFP